MSAAKPTSHVEILRANFDRGFAEPVREMLRETDDFLAIRVGGDPYALRLAEITRVFVDRRITPVPSRAAHLLGVAGFRGALVPIYDLAAVLRRPSTAAPRWTIIVDAPTPLGLGFEHFESHRRVDRASVVVDSRSGEGRSYTRAALHDDGVVRPILDLRSIFDSLKEGAHRMSQHEE